MYKDRVFSVKGQEDTVPPLPISVPPRRLVPPPAPEDESDAMDTDDDPVTDAIRAVIDGDTDEEVVYPRASPPAKLSSDLPQMIPQHVTPPHINHQSISSPGVALPQLPSPDVLPLPISPPRLPPHLSPPRSRPGSDIFATMVPTHVDVRARALSFSQQKPAGTTAQDLLNGVLGLSPAINDPAPAASPLFSGLGGLSSSVWSPVNDVRLPPIGQQRHQRSVSQFNPSLAPGTRPGNGLGLTTGLSPFLPTPNLPQSPSHLSWQPNQLPPPQIEATTHPRPNPIGHHRAQSSGVAPHLTSPGSVASTLLGPRSAQPNPSVPLSFNSIDAPGGLSGAFPSDFLARQGLSPASQTPSYNLPFGNSLGIQGSGWER